MPRLKSDEFTQNIRNQLKLEVGSKCSNPACRKNTDGGGQSIGEAAHITALSSGGARYNSSMPNPQRRSAENGIWLCRICHKLVDSDPLTYSTELLIKWKIDAIQKAKEEIGKRHTYDDVQHQMSLQLSCKLYNSSKDEYKIEAHLVNNDERSFNLSASYKSQIIIPGREPRLISGFQETLLTPHTSKLLSWEFIQFPYGVYNPNLLITANFFYHGWKDKEEKRHLGDLVTEAKAAHLAEYCRKLGVG